jgi:formyltetrahydrofolate synthetase
MTVLLKDALKPNLIQTLEGQPCFMHIGPFGNIAHGNSSIVADLAGRKLGEYLITEAGFGSDLGMEKFMDIVCRAGGFAPNAVVIVATAKALKHHAGLEDDPRNSTADNLRAIEEGSANLGRHIVNAKEFGVPCVVAANRFPGDTDDEVALVQKLALEHGAHAAVLNEGFSKGGEGAADMAEAVADACDQPSSFAFVYEDSDPIDVKIEKIATRVYQADGVDFLPAARQKIEQFTRDGLTGLSICMAKTHLSLSADPAVANAPTGFRIPVRDIRPYTGAGFLTALCGDIMQMPGLAESPRRTRTARPTRTCRPPWPGSSTTSQPGPPPREAALPRRSRARWRPRSSRWRPRSRRPRGSSAYTTAPTSCATRSRHWRTRTDGRTPSSLRRSA